MRSKLGVAANPITGLSPDQIFFRQAGTSKRNVLTDALGSTLATASSAATPAIQNSYTYDPFGTPNAATFPYLFTGRDYNSANGLQYNRARYYTPAYGRFVSEDPIGILGGLANGYIYGADAPTTFSDPRGLLLGRVGVMLGGLLAQIMSVISPYLKDLVNAMPLAAIGASSDRVAEGLGRGALFVLNTVGLAFTFGGFAQAGVWLLGLFGVELAAVPIIVVAMLVGAAVGAYIAYVDLQNPSSDWEPQGFTP